MSNRVCITGGRNVWLEKKHFDALDLIHADLAFSVLECGMAAGVDACAYAWATLKGIPVNQNHADWDGHGRGAGPRRNGEMARRIDYLIVFSGGYGTQNMISAALRVGGVRIIDLRSESLLKDWHHDAR